MLDFHEKRRLVRILYSRYFLAFLCLPVAFAVYVAHHAYAGAQETRQQKLELAAQLADLKKRALTLEGDISQLNDPYGMEAALRERYDVGREGEQAIVLVGPPTEEATATPVMVPKPTFWQRVWNFF
jgi:cell division protein FtsB